MLGWLSSAGSGPLMSMRWNGTSTGRQGEVNDRAPDREETVEARWLGCEEARRGGCCAREDRSDGRAVSRHGRASSLAHLAQRAGAAGDSLVRHARVCKE